MAKLTIRYFDVLPGVGKTSWAISEMLNRMKSQEVITLYVSPTVKLLQQVRHDLLKKAAVAGIESPNKLIKFIEATPESGQYRTWLPVAEQLRLALEGGKTFYDKKAEPAVKSPLGTIIFLTHEAFLKRCYIKKTNVSVIFDEARKFVTKPEKITFKNKQEEAYFSKFLKEGSEPLLNADGKKTPFYKVTREKVPKDYHTKIASPDSRRQYPALDVINDTIRNPDIDLYVSENLEVAEGKVKVKGKKRFRFHQVVLPNNIFVGFKEVILLSAFLTDSQMWHLLSANPSIHLANMEDDGPYQESVNRILYQRSKSIKYNLGLINIIPLTRQDELVSLTRYNQGILVPESAKFLLKLGLEKAGYSKTKDAMALMASRDHLDLTDNQELALHYLDKYGAKLDTFNWYCETALKVVNKLSLKGELVGKPLAVANRKYGLDDRIRSDYDQFIVIPIQSYGINEYKEYNCIFFAAAINADLESKKLYAALLPNYDYAMDHVADACTQCVTRLSVRDVNSNKKVYVIVPDLAMANLLFNKLKQKPVINTVVANHYQMTTFNHLNPKRKTTVEKVKYTSEEKAKANQSKAERWRSDATNKQLASKRSAISRYTKRLKEQGPDEKITLRVESLEQDIKELLSKKQK